MKMTKEKDGRYLLDMKSWSTFCDTLGEAIKQIVDHEDQI